jgi:hypothetical protein
MIELTVIVKNDESKLVERQLVYESMQLDKNNPVLNEIINSALKKFGSSFIDESPDITVKAKMIWQ